MNVAVCEVITVLINSLDCNPLVYERVKTQCVNSRTCLVGALTGLQKIERRLQVGRNNSHRAGFPPLFVPLTDK